MATTNWKHEPETKEFSESWTAEEIEAKGILARVLTVHEGVYEAYIYPKGKSRKVGDIYKSPSSAKAACKRALEAYAKSS